MKKPAFLQTFDFPYGIWHPQGEVALGFPASRNTCAYLHIVTDRSGFESTFEEYENKKPILLKTWMGLFILVSPRGFVPNVTLWTPFSGISKTA
jgi:hypothetical protein